MLKKLKEIVRGTEEFRAAKAEGKLLALPTGDGGALVFRTSPEAAVLCAIEISRELKHHPQLRVRMGIHSGPVNEITDLNEQANLAGAGINMAQRVMDCGDAGHILVSQHVADDLMQYRQWVPRLRDLGECEVKHGVRLHLVNLYAEPLGNPEVPEKFRQGKEMAQTAVTARASGRNKLLLVVLGIVIFFFICLSIVALIFAPAVMKSLSRQGAVMPPPSAPSATASTVPEKSIAVLPFENLSSDKENAYFTDGVQDEILTNLSRIADLKVISRTSVM